MDTRPHITYDTRLRIDGEPALIQAGTLHYFRLPHPDLWEPVLRRMRAGGLNAVVVPFPWAYHSPAPGLYDFTGPRDVRQLLDAVEAAGLWLIADVGPWIEAGLNAGGLPTWFLNAPNTRPDCDSDVPAGPSFAFLRYVREWWERLFPLFVQRPNLLALTLDPGPCGNGQGLPRFFRALRDLAGEIGVQVPITTPDVNISPPGDDAHPNDGKQVFPLQRLNVAEIADWAIDPGGFTIIETGSAQPWTGEGRPRTPPNRSPERLRIAVSRVLGNGSMGYTLAPAHGGIDWGYVGTANQQTYHGIGTPVRENTASDETFFHTRRMAFTAETLGDALITSQPAQTVYTAHSDHLRAARTAPNATVTFLDTAGSSRAETHLSMALGDAMLTATPIILPEDAARVLPLNWQLCGGRLLTTTLEPVLRITVAGRHLLVLANEDGGDLLLSDDFRPRHARGPVRTQRTDAGLAVHFEAARWISLLLDGPDGPLQLLALTPHFAARVWPLDDTWRTTPAYPAAWNPAPEDPARGLVIGPEMVWPHPDGGYAFLVKEKGFGYRWGPWRGSDPHTWLAPLSWREPPTAKLPELTWASRPGAPEIAPDYDDSTWLPTAIAAAPAPGQRHGSEGFTWYRGRFNGTAGALTLHCDQACDVFLNGTHIAALNTPQHAVPGTPKTLPLPAHLLRAENVLAILVENIGNQQNWEETARVRGLRACALDSGAPLQWRARYGLGGEQTVQGFPGYADWALVPGEGSTHITWHRATFALNLPDDVEMPLYLFVDQAATRIYLFLNGQLIGRYWEGRSTQHRFWLPEGILRRKGGNELLLAQWTRGAQPGIGVARLESGAILQWHV